MPEPKTEDSRFLVDLDHSRAPRAFESKYSLWGKDIQRLYRLVERHVKALDYHEKQEDCGRFQKEELPHLSIAIFGPSGSGKSSLLRTIAKDVGQRDSLLPEGLKSGVVSLPVMDPTTWGKSDQFLYAFLAAALEEERQRQTEKKHGYPQGLSPVQLAFQEVNEYLRVVDEPERHEEHDPLGLSLQKLERHTSGLRLRSALADLVEALAKELGAKIVLLPIDDLDMAPDHLVKSIQTYQSFLTHARLVPIFTFTDRMPEEVLEVKFRRELGDGATFHDRDPSARLSISEQMAVQFLARSFPVRNRIRLGPAPARVQRAVFQKSLHTEERMEVRELLTIASFLLFGHPDREDSHQVRAALRPSTLRRQFQVVDAMTDCQLEQLRSLQLGAMAGLSEDKLEEIEPKNHQGFTKEVADKPLRKVPEKERARMSLAERRAFDGYLHLAKNLHQPKIDATWASIFNGATWSLLNVHRDTLRELGLFLEDLYSWSPKELRSVVLDNILLQDRATQRTVVDRWFNRTDYRRSQVLSLLAANIFRPWMVGEEPYGDEEVALGRQLQIEKEGLVRGREPGVGEECKRKAPADWKPHEQRKKIEDHLTIPVSQGFLWFLNVTLGFYLPQIMARNWSEAVPDLPVKERMGGNGWDLQNASVHAVRLADAKQEIMSFGMAILDNKGYRQALEFDEEKNGTLEKIIDGLTSRQENPPEATKKLCGAIEKELELFDEPDDHGPLLLRLWSCCGYSFGRYWSAFSLWRGLGFIGQVLEVGWRLAEEKKLEQSSSPDEHKEKLKDEIARLIRSHCLKGLVLGPLYSQSPTDDQLLHGFPPWNPEKMKEEINRLTDSLVVWLDGLEGDHIFPLPAGTTWIGWRNCFVRRIHGEYILGALWPRLNAAVLEQQESVAPHLGQWRSGRFTKSEQFEYETWSKEDDVFRWSAATAANAWSDILLEYWRGSPGILHLLLSCPVFYKSRRFLHLDQGLREAKKTSKTSKNRIELSKNALNELLRKDHWLARLLRKDGAEGEADPELWKKLLEGPWKDRIPALVRGSLVIERTQTKDFGHSAAPTLVKIVRSQQKAKKPKKNEDTQPTETKKQDNG